MVLLIRPHSFPVDPSAVRSQKWELRIHPQYPPHSFLPIRHTCYRLNRMDPGTFDLSTPTSLGTLKFDISWTAGDSDWAIPALETRIPPTHP